MVALKVNFKLIALKSKVLLMVIFLALSLQVFGQDAWENWDRRYPAKSYKELINTEKCYADSVEKDKEIPQYYARSDRYRITAKFMGKSRSVDSLVFDSMKRVFKLFFGNTYQLDGMIKTEYLFEVDGFEVWMPIQAQLEEPLNEEIEPGTEIVLYCLFLNEHTSNGKLFNTLLISEFR